MSRSRVTGILVVAAVALATGFLVAGQVKAQLLTPSNQVARYQALVRSVQDLEATNADSRQKIATIRSQIDALEAAGRIKAGTTLYLSGASHIDPSATKPVRIPAVSLRSSTRVML